MSRNQYLGKRIAGIDFGNTRVGIAICDELHITVTPILTLHYNKLDFWEKLDAFIKEKKVSAFVVGIPYNSENIQTEVIQEIKSFIVDLTNRTGLKVFEYDESYSTKRAVETMIANGKKKKYRSSKENKDKFAAAIILKDFLNEIHN